DRGRGQSSVPSWGRRKRAVRTLSSKSKINRNNSTKNEEEEVHQMLEVYLSHEDVPESKRLERPSQSSNTEKICVDKFAYYTLGVLSALFVLLFVVLLPYFAVVKAAKLKYKVSLRLL